MLTSKHRALRIALPILLLVSMQACASPLVTYRDTLTDTDKAIANNVTALMGYYSTANKLAVRSYLDARIAALEHAKYQNLKKQIIISPDQIRIRVQVIAQLTAFSNMMLQVALAKDAEEFKSKAIQAGAFAEKAAGELKKASGTIVAVVPLAVAAVNLLPAEKTLSTAGEVVGEVGKYLMEVKAERRLDKAFTKENMRRINDILIFLSQDMIDCANKLEEVLTTDSSHMLAGFNLYTDYVKSLRGKWTSSRDKNFLEARAGFTTKRDDTVEAMMKVLQVKSEPATEGLSALIDLNDALVVYAVSKQTKADKEALQARAKASLAASNAVLESLKIYEPSKSSDKDKK
jgi:hypothetical protein